MSEEFFLEHYAQQDATREATQRSNQTRIAREVIASQQVIAYLLELFHQAPPLNYTYITLEGDVERTPCWLIAKIGDDYPYVDTYLLFDGRVAQERQNVTRIVSFTPSLASTVDISGSVRKFADHIWSTAMFGSTRCREEFRKRYLR